MTLVSIVGDFSSSVLPVIYAFRDQIERQVIVYDGAKKEQRELERIVAGCETYRQSFPDECANPYSARTMQVDEDSRESILACYQRILDIESDPEKIYLNTTDGLESIGLLLSSWLLEAGGKVIVYDRFDNTYNLHSKEGMQKHSLKENMDIQSHLMLKGYTIKGSTDKALLKARKEVVLRLTRNLPAYKKFADAFQGNKGPSQIYGNDEYKRLLKSIGMLDNTYFIQGTVFEEYIYHLLDEHFDFDDIWVSTTVEFSEGVENEFDILMIRENHLHTIECKFKRDLNGKGTLYKTYMLMDYLDEDGKAMVLSIGGENRNRNAKAYGPLKFSPSDKARALRKQIKIHQSKNFDKRRFLKDVKNWFCES